MGRFTKGQVVSAILAGRPKYIRNLVSDIVYAKVAIPQSWREPADATVLTLDAAALLDSEQAARCHDLTEKAQTLIEIVVTLVRQYVSERSDTDLPDKNDRDSLRRGRGPAAVRDLLIHQLPYWPETAPDGLGEDVEQVLDKVLASRRTSQCAPIRPREEMQRLLGPLLEPTRAIVLEWAAAKRLPEDAAEEVIGEAIDQLYRSVVKIGRAPENLRRWTLVTAAKKWQAITAQLTVRALPQTRTEDVDGYAEVRDTVGDEAATTVDLNRWIQDAATQLRRLAAAYTSEEPAMQDDALSCEVAADLLELADVDIVIAVVQDCESGSVAVAEQLARRGRVLSPDRKVAVQRLIGDTLRRIYEGG